MKKLMILLCCFVYIKAEVYIPKNPSEVILELDKEVYSKEILQLEEAYENNPLDFMVLNSLAAEYIELGRRKSNQRYFGYAQAILTPFLSQAVPPYELQQQYADVLQFQHQFSKALIQLEALKQRRPEDENNYMMSANIYFAQGKYTSALKECKQMLLTASPLMSTACITQAQAYLKDPQEAYTLLEENYERHQDEALESKVWALSVLSDIALHLNQPALSKKHLRDLVSMQADNYYALALLADILLEEKAYEEVIPLVQNFTYVPSLQLRLARAQDALQETQAKVNIQVLNAYFSELEQAEESIHLREQAMFEFYLHANAQKAWDLAVQNIHIQKEYTDIKLLHDIAKALDKDEITLNKVLQGDEA